MIMHAPNVEYISVCSGVVDEEEAFIFSTLLLLVLGLLDILTIGLDMAEEGIDRQGEALLISAQALARIVCYAV